MTSTITNIKHISLGNAEAVIADLDVTSYSTGGEAIAAADLGLGTTVDFVSVIGTEAGTDSDHIGYWDETNSKMEFFVGTTGAEVAAAVNLGTHKILAIAAVD